MSLPLEASVHKNTCSVNPPVLPRKVLEALETKYRRHTAVNKLADLKQGDRDVLEEARRQLGWPSLLSLSLKYFSLYPYRHAWRRALEKCSHQKFRTATLNIKYLLQAVITQVNESLARSYSGKEVLNRLLHPKKNSIEVGSNRLVQQVEVIKPAAPQPDPDRYLNQKYAHMVLR